MPSFQERVLWRALLAGLLSGFLLLSLGIAAAPKTVPRPSPAPSPGMKPPGSAKKKVPAGKPRPKGSPSPSANGKPEDEDSDSITISDGPPFQFISNPENKSKVQGLQLFPSKPADLRIENFEDGFRAFGTVRGKYDKPEWALLSQQKHLNEKGPSFMMSVPIKGPTTELKFETVGPSGETEKEVFTITVSEWEKRIKKLKAKPPKRFSLSVGVGPTYLTFEQSKISSFKEYALTTKMTLNFLVIPPSWDIGFNFFVNALPFGSSHAQIKDFRVLGSNLRFGWVLPFIKEPWRTAVHLGFSYSTILSSQKVGYSNLIWPQIYPTVRRAFKGGHALFVYFKYASVAGNDESGLAAVFSMKSRELAGGGGWTILLKNNHPLIFGLDYSNIAVEFSSASKIKTSSLTLSGGYGW